MAIPAGYTEATLKEYMHTVLGPVATTLGWTVADGDYDEAANEAVAAYGVDDVAAVARLAGRVQDEHGRHIQAAEGAGALIDPGQELVRRVGRRLLDGRIGAVEGDVGDDGEKAPAGLAADDDVAADGHALNDGAAIQLDGQSPAQAAGDDDAQAPGLGQGLGRGPGRARPRDKSIQLVFLVHHAPTLPSVGTRAHRHGPPRAHHSLYSKSAVLFCQQDNNGCGKQPILPRRSVPPFPSPPPRSPHGFNSL